MKQKGYIIIFICLFTLMFTACSSQQETEINELKQIITPVPTISSNTVLPYEQLDLPEDFQEKAYEHVQNITSFGVREVGSDAEASTIDYIMNYLGQSGIEANKEEFKFQYYNLNKVMINGTEVNCDKIYFNPYNDPELSGEGKIYYQSDDEHGEIAIQKNSVPPDVLYEAMNDTNIKAVLITSVDYFNQIHNEKDLQVTIEGNTEECTSYNVVAKINSTKSDAKDIIISAHMDSIYGVGADDNATGVGAALELAKYYYSMKDALSYNIIFVFFGAEEVGFLGSQAYISIHAEDLSNCILVFNIDTIGGKYIYIESSGAVQGDFCDLQTPVTNICARTDYEYKWWTKEATNYCSAIPDWLLMNIKNSCSELKFTFQSSAGIGSDHQMFAKYGIPSTGITLFGNMVNTVEDTPDMVDSGSMLKAAQIVASVVNKTMLTYSIE